MGSSGDNNPLWGSAQYNYPDFNQPGPSSAWPDSAMFANTQPPYDHFAGMREEINYSELKTEYPIAMSEAEPTIPEGYPRIYSQPQQQQHIQHLSAGAAPPVPHGGYIPGLLPPTPFLNSNNILLAEPPSYLPPIGTIRQMSPDAGYSSPSSVSSDYYGPQLHGGHATPEYTTMMSPYPNTMPAEELQEVGTPVKQEYQDMQPAIYTKQLEYIVQNVDESKPIIHENIQICPPLQLDPPQMQNYTQPQQPIQFSFTILSEEPHVQKDHVQPEVNGQDDIICLDDQPPAVPSTSSAVQQPTPPPAVPSTSSSSEQQPGPSTSSTAKRGRESSESQSPKPKNPRKSAADMAQVEPELRRSARPSAIKHSDFGCDMCGEFFARQCGLTQHKKWIHEPRTEGCRVCGKMFPTVATLRTHLARHSDQNKQFKCDQCPKSFCHANDLRRHRFRHTDTAPFICTECGRGFIRSDHLVSHTASHERRRQAAARKTAKKQQPQQQQQQQQPVQESSDSAFDDQSSDDSD